MWEDEPEPPLRYKMVFWLFMVTLAFVLLAGIYHSL